MHPYMLLTEAYIELKDDCVKGGDRTAASNCNYYARLICEKGLALEILPSALAIGMRQYQAG